MNSLGLADGDLRLELGHADWALAFTEESARLLPALPPSGLLEHIGSSAVPGLPAKPVLDLAVQLPEPQISVLEVRLPALGYRFRGDAEAAGGRVWVRENGRLRTHILHVVQPIDPQWRRWLALRDLLRSSEAARQLYLEAKELTLASGCTRREFTRAKTDTISRLLTAEDQSFL
jgi:GrpB-like predicted nucleotidyltransferase (UPF0157 family)